MVKTIPITFNDEEFNILKEERKQKKYKNWKDFFMNKKEEQQ